MKQYHKLLEDILEHGEETTDRTGVGTRSIFGYQMRFDLTAGFPAVTTKKLAWRAVVGELLWFLEGSTDERRLAELTYGKDRTELVGKSTIWTTNAGLRGADRPTARSPATTTAAGTGTRLSVAENRHRAARPPAEESTRVSARPCRSRDTGTRSRRTGASAATTTTTTTTE